MNACTGHESQQRPASHAVHTGRLVPSAPRSHRGSPETRRRVPPQPLPAHLGDAGSAGGTPRAAAAARSFRPPAELCPDTAHPLLRYDSFPQLPPHSSLTLFVSRVWHKLVLVCCVLSHLSDGRLLQSQQLTHMPRPML